MSALLFMNFRILFLIWIYITGCYTQNDIPEVAVVEDNLPTNEGEDPSMPPKLNMTINLLQNDSNNVNLKLGMNRALNEQRSIYVIRTNKAGQPVLRKQQIPIEGNIAFYQDKDTGANVMMTCDGFEVGHCDPILEGSFYVKNVEYGLEPITEDSPLRRKRSLNGRRGKLYSVFRRKQDKPVKNDFEPSTESVNNGAHGQSMQLVDRVVDLSEFMNPASATMEMRRRTSDTDVQQRQRKQRKRKKNLSSTPYQMGLIVIIDFSIYQTWYRRSDKTSPAERDIDAKSKIRQYMAHVINGVDLRFQNLRSNRIKIVVSRYIIADTPGASPWTSRRFIAQPRDLIYADDALNELIKWRYRMGHELPSHDHTILFTGYDLYRPTLANKGVAGFARVSSMCSHSSVSVVEEHGGFGSVLTATHEIGHSLGAYHDGHNNTCAGEDNFIMTPIGGSATPSNALNPFHFSECSEDAFNNLIESLPPNHCLTDETDIYDQEEFDSYLTQKAGQLYGPNEQCRQHLGSESYYAWGGILGEANEVCTHMACKNAMSNTSFNIYYAAQGTSCGNKKWCVDGECLYEEKAPKRNDTCVHGDAWRDFGGLTCAQYVSADPSRCYYSYYSRFCCVSCNSLRTGDPGCEYGNRKKKVCKMVEKDPKFCYHDNNENLCCGTCKKHNTGITGCEYGDRLPNCTIERCANEAYSKKCCSTCRQFKPEKVRPVSPVRESVSSTISMSPKINSDGTSTPVPLKSDTLPSLITKSTFTLPKPIPKSPTTQQEKDQENTFVTTHKVEGIKVSQLGPITPLNIQGDLFPKPLVTQTKNSGFIPNRDWKSRQPIRPKTALLSQPVVVSNYNEGPINQTNSVKIFPNSEKSDNSMSLNSIFPKENHPQIPSNETQPPVVNIQSANVTEPIQQQELIRKRTEHEKQKREQQKREEQANEQREHRLQQQRLQREKEQKQRDQRMREQRDREQQQREERQREQRQREQRLREQQEREQRQREQQQIQQRQQRQREQQLRELRQREQQLREQRQREQQLREQRQRELQLREQRELQQRERRNHQLRQQRHRNRHEQKPNRNLGSTQLIVRPKHQSRPPRIFHVNRFPSSSRSTSVLNKLRQNSIRPKVTTTTTTTTTTAAPPLVQIASIFNYPKQERCVKPGALFMSLKCDWLVRLMKGLCKNSILGGVCCEDCAPVEPRKPVCVDDVDCSIKRAAQCYDDLHRSQCCATCKAFKTEYPDCEYGDREKHCGLFLRYMPNYTCDAFKKGCCLSCKRRIVTTTVPPVVMTTARWSDNVWDSSFNSRHSFRQNDRIAENNNVFHWNK